MPFVKQTLRPQIEARNIFIGRTNELHFFIEHILKPEGPTYHVVSVWGDAGVGKSTLLTRFRDEARAADFKDCCLTALVAGRRLTPARIMEHWAAQLRLAGSPLPAFEDMLARYKEAVQEQQSEQEAARATFVHHVSRLMSSGIRGAPVIGGLYETVAEAASASFWSQRQPRQPAGETENRSDPLDDLTQAFVEDLNWLTATQVLLPSQRATRELRVILLFDGVEPAAAETVSWLRNQLLHATISHNVVLVVAGREPLERSLPPAQTSYSMSLAPFTEDETRTYLTERGITNADRLATLWQLSGGLPLSLGMLAFDPEGSLDPAANVVTNMLRWLAGQGQSRQRFVLHAALFSRPFTQDDLAAFPSFSERERTSLYRWLIGLPFVQYSSLDGRHRSHDLIQELLSRAFSQRSPQDYQATHRALANHYRRRLEYLQAIGGKRIYLSAEWLELALAHVVQLFSLSDETSHLSAIEQVMTIAHEAKQEGELVIVLRELSQEHPDTLVNASAKQVARLLLHYIEADLVSQEFLAAASDLLAEVSHAPTFPAPLLARIYCKRGTAYFARNEHQRAMADFDRALALDPAYSWAYLLRGTVYSFRNESQQAIEDFDRVLALDSRNSFAYAYRGIAYRKLKDYERAMADFDRVLLLDPHLDGAALLRSLTYGEFSEGRRGLGSFDQVIELDPNDAWAYVLRGMALCSLGEYDRAIKNLDRALQLNPNDAQAYAGRGHVYLEMGNIGQARDDFRRSQERDPNDVQTGLLLEWTDLCQQGPQPETPARLEAMAAVNPQQYAAYICRAVALLLRERFEEALAELEQALLLDASTGHAYFWKSLACAFLGRDEEAVAAMEQALAAELPLPEVLFTPLRWLEPKKSDFYSKYAAPLLANL